MTIGELARKSGVEAQTIRYYERIGLIAQPPRTASNYRMYGESVIQRMTFIKRSKQIGFTLSDIKVLLAMSDRKIRRCRDVREFADTRLKKVRGQIAHLKLIEKVLSALVEQCSQSEQLDECPIMESLTRGMD